MFKKFSVKCCWILCAVFFMAACTTTKMHMTVPEKFEEQAERLPIAGLVNNGAGRKPISFGVYKTSRVKRGWSVTSGSIDRNTKVTLEERLMKVLNIGIMNTTSTQKDRFSFSITDGQISAQLFGIERRVKEEVRFNNSRSQLLNGFGMNSLEKNFQYSFSAIIDVHSVAFSGTWNMLLYSNYDYTQKSKIFDHKDIREEGLLTNQQDTVFIKAIKAQSFITDKGEEQRLPFAVSSAYEFRNEDGVYAIIDTWGKILWIYRELDDATKLVISAAASSIILRRVTSSGIG